MEGQLVGVLGGEGGHGGAFGVVNLLWPVRPTAGAVPGEEDPVDRLEPGMALQVITALGFELTQIGPQVL